MDGWIKLHRQIKDHWLWRSDNRLKWWIDILLSVSYTDSKVLIKGTLIECKRGQSIRSLDSWARDWNVSKGSVRDFFKLLQSDQMITLESLVFTTRITVCKYDDYQMELNGEKTEKKRKVNAKDTQALPIKEREEEQECKEGIEYLMPIEDKNWKTDFEFYKSELRKVYKELISDALFILEQEKFNPNVDIKLSIEKACTNFWATEAGWNKKKKSRPCPKNIDWKSTLTNAISMNKVYKNTIKVKQLSSQQDLSVMNYNEKP
ncbi:MAG TPA: hypothetical protein DCS19_04320 [Flavobacterium sp.]|nr:hypothetical protein [Flavobacterium sp.]